jgi:phosphoglucosamine mutase
MKMNHFFGTDGIRGLYGQHPLTPQGMWSLGYALGRWILDQGGVNPFVFIGKDTRASCDAIEQSLSGGLNACGIGTISIGCAPTPAVSFLTRIHRASAGLMISASHNPAMYNGVKIFNGVGDKLSIDQERMISSYISQHHGWDSGVLPIPSGTHYLREYQDFLIHSTPELPPLRIVVDCAHGAYSAIAAHILKAKGAVVVDVLGANPDGHNINAECGAVYPQRLAGAVVHHGADVGISFDGDGDRVILVTADGEIQDGDQILALLAQNRYVKHHSRNDGGQNDSEMMLKAMDAPTGSDDWENPLSQSNIPQPESCGVVGTVLSNLGLERFLQSKNIPFVRTHVGDRWIAKRLKELGWTLGGESCGHIILADALPTGDGLLAGLHALQYIGAHGYGRGAQKQGLFPIFQPTPSAMVNMPLRAPQFCQHPKFLDYYQRIQSQMGENQRVLLRQSGTEPVLRILVEGGSQAFVVDLAQTIAKDLDEEQRALEGTRV